MNRISLAALSLLAGASPSAAHSELYTITDPDLDQVFGQEVLGLADLDGDGVRDFAVADSNLVGFGIGRVNVYSGATGAVLWQRTAPPGGFQYGLSLSPVGDLDGDGVEELVVGVPLKSPPPPGAMPFVELLSGADGALLQTLTESDPASQVTWGEAVLGVDDLDGDGLADVLVGAGSDGDFPLELSGSVRAYSSATGKVLWTIDGDVAYGVFGDTLAGLDDLNGDGIGEFLVGAPGTVSVRLCNGADGKEIGPIVGSSSWVWFGGSVASMGDSTGDGVEEIVVGSWFEGGKQGAARTFDIAPLLVGGKAELLFTVKSAGPGAATGRSVCAGGDFDGDGVPDFGVGSDFESPNGSGIPGQLEIFSGADGTSLFVATGETPTGSWRYALAADLVGDLNGDGRPEFVVGEPGESRAHVVGADMPLEADGHLVSLAAGGSVAFDLDAGATHAGEFYWVLGTASGPAPGIDLGGGILLPLTFDGWFSLTLSSPSLPIFGQFLSVLDGGGAAAASLDLPAGLSPGLAGVTLHHAFVTLGGGSVTSASNAVPVTLVP